MSRNQKNESVTAFRRSKPDQFFVDEYLTPQRQIISHVLCRAKQEFPNIVSGSFSFDGKAYIWLKPPNLDAPGCKRPPACYNQSSSSNVLRNSATEHQMCHFLTFSKSGHNEVFLKFSITADKMFLTYVYFRRNCLRTVIQSGHR